MRDLRRRGLRRLCAGLLLLGAGSLAMNGCGADHAGAGGGGAGGSVGGSSGSLGGAGGAGGAGGSIAGGVKTAGLQYNGTIGFFRVLP